MEDFLVPVEVPDERLEPAFEIERALAIVPFVGERDPDPLREVGGLAEPLADQLERILGRLEHLGIGEKARRRPSPGPLGTDLPDRGRGLAARVLLRPDELVARRFDAHPRREGVDDADADAVQSARHLVAAVAELGAGMEDGMDDFERVLARGVLAHRHSASVVLDDDDAVLLDRDRDRVGLAGHRLVDRVVDDLPDEVMQASFVRRADVHARPLPDGLETLEDLDAGGVVIRGRTCALASASRGDPIRRVDRRLRSERRLRTRRPGGFFGHAVPPVRRS